MNDEEKDLDQLLEFVSLKLYETLADLHEALANKIGQTEADDIIVNAMAVNMGHVIGQLDVKKQKKYATLARSLIKEHMLLGTMQKDLFTHGQIGHA